MALSENPTIAELQALAEKYADEEFTREDSLDAGNCEEGTDEFIEESLYGRTTFTIRDLAPHIESNYGVRKEQLGGTYILDCDIERVPDKPSGVGAVYKQG